MLGLSDLITIAVINDGLTFLAANPRHIEFILGSYSSKEIQQLVGVEHIKQCVEYITNNRIEVMPFYQLDHGKRPSIAVVSSGTESQQFIGDYGSQTAPEVIMPAITYASFGAKAIDGDTISVSPSLKLDQKIWRNIFIVNGDFKAKLSSVLVRDGEDTKLTLNKDIPEGTPLLGWSARSSEQARGATLSASVDDVSVQCKLTTQGDFSIHRLLSVVLRYCLKRGRSKFNELGLQVATFGYSPPLATDNDEFIFESVYTISGKYTDHWIDFEWDAPDEAANIIMEFCSTAEGQETVKLT